MLEKEKEEEEVKEIWAFSKSGRSSCVGREHLHSSCSLHGRGSSMDATVDCVGKEGIHAAGSCDSTPSHVKRWFRSFNHPIRKKWLKEEMAAKDDGTEMEGKQSWSVSRSPVVLYEIHAYSKAGERCLFHKREHPSPTGQSISP